MQALSQIYKIAFELQALQYLNLFKWKSSSVLRARTAEAKSADVSQLFCKSYCLENWHENLSKGYTCQNYNFQILIFAQAHRSDW